MTLCPCKSKLPYKDCCKRFHDGKALPPTARDLMRSRFSAYALRLIDYIIESTHPDYPNRPGNINAWKKDLLRFSERTRFDDLKILEFVDGEESSTVTFTAHLRQGSQDASFTEKSFFNKVNGKWLYRSGETKTSLV